MSKRVVLLLLIGIIAIASAMRLYGLDNQSLWYDEVSEETAFYRQFLTKQPTIKPYTPPLNLFFIYPMTRLFPGSDFALRVVPFTFGVLSVPLMYLLGRKIFDEKVGLISSFLLAISPFHIWYSQEARMYSLQWMLTLISIIFFLRMLDRSERGNIAGYIISTTAGLYTHQLTVFLPFLQGLYIVFHFNKYRQSILKHLGILSTTAILYLPWIIYSLSAFSDKSAGISKAIDIKVLLYTFYTYCVGFSIGPSLRELHLNQSLSVIEPYLFEIISLMTLYGALFMIGLWSLRKDRSNLFLLLLILLVPIAGLLTLNVILPNISYNVRYTGTAFFGLLLIFAKALDYLGNIRSERSGRLLVLLSILAISGSSIYSYINYQFESRYAKPNIRDAVAYIEKNKMSNDLVLCVINNPTFDRYSQNAYYFVSFPYNTDPDDVKDIELKLKKLLAGKKRLWLALNTEWYQAKLAEHTKFWLDTNFHEIEQFRKDKNEIANVRIYIYDLTKKISPKN